VITFFAAIPAEVGEYELAADVAHHAAVRRVSPGEPLTVVAGDGARRLGTLVVAGKKSLRVLVDRVERDPEPAAVHLFLPVADRDRMLWLAEKAAELQLSSWTPVLYRRSRSVSPRGEGDAFDRKVLTRMQSALEQSGGAWLPVIRPTIESDAFREGIAPGLLLDASGTPLAGHRLLRRGIAFAVGPEGGLEPAEQAVFANAGWQPASVGSVTLRFETAAIAALAIARSSLA
jgi:16S rRNA (uracil1498-N3)-methyltransferase